MDRPPSFEQEVIVVSLKRTQHVRRVMLLNDLLPGIIVVLSGISLFESGLHFLVAAVNILAGCALLFFGIKEWRSDPEEESGFNWVDIFGGIVVALDATAMYKPWKGFQPAWVNFLLAIAIVLRGFFPSLFPRLRKLRIDRNGFSIRFSPFSSYECVWSSIESLSTEPTSFTLHYQDGSSRSFSLNKVENRQEVLETLKKYAVEIGIRV